MSQLLPSLELVSDLVLSERAAQLRHVESLDTKAGIVLGFSGAVVALAARRGNCTPRDRYPLTGGLQ